MNNGLPKCEKCGKPLKQSGPYANDKREGEPAHKGPIKINFWCMNDDCENRHKNIEVISD